MIKVVFVFFGILHATFGQNEAAFIKFRTEMETRVQHLANNMTKVFKNRCSDTRITNCEIKSYFHCEGTSQKWCNYQFPQNQADCGTKGTSISTMSSIRFPTSKNVSQLTNEEALFVCGSATLENQLKEFDVGRNKMYTLAYVGSSTGGFRHYPSNKEPLVNGACKKYDPRLRPWYVAAITGQKNMVIMIDISGYMSSVIKTVKTTAIDLINSLSNANFVSVIVFNNSVSSLVGGKIKKATKEYKKDLIQAINQTLSETPQGKSNYTQAFKQALNMIELAHEDRTGTPCIDNDNFILFMSDGRTSESVQNTVDFINSTKDHSHTIKVFTFGFGSNSTSNHTFLRDLSCSFGGIMFSIQKDSDIADKLTGYYQYISLGAKNQKPMWSEPYDDHMGFGKLFTVSIPIYYQDTQFNFKRIIGVAGLDILYDKMLSFGFNESSVIDKLENEDQTLCTQTNFSYCEMQDFRDQKAKCNYQNESCTINYSISTCQIINKTKQDLFIKPKDTEHDFCCPQEPPHKYVLHPAIIAGICVCFPIIIGIAIIIWKKTHPSSGGDESLRKKDENKPSIERFNEQSPIQLPSYESNEQHSHSHQRLNYP